MIKIIFQGVLDFIKTAFYIFINIFQGDWQGAWNLIKDFFARTCERIKVFHINTLNALQIAFNAIIEWLKSVFVKDWTQQFGIVGNIINGLSQNIKNSINGIQTIFNGVIDFIKNVFIGNWKEAWEAVVRIFSGIFQTLSSAVKAPMNVVIGILNAAIDGINKLLYGLNKIKINVPAWVPLLGGKSFGINIPSIPKIPMLAKGGIVSNGSRLA